MATLALNATAMTAAETNTVTTVVTEVDKSPSTTMTVVATVPPVAVFKSRQAAYDNFFKTASKGAHAPKSLLLFEG